MSSSNTKDPYKYPLDGLNPSALELQPAEVAVQSSILQPVVNSFLKNFADIDAIYSLPIHSARELARQEIEFQVTLEALLKDNNWEGVVNPEGDRSRFETEARRLWSEKVSGEDAKYRIALRIGEFKREHLKDNQFRSSVSVVATSIATMLWTTFECLSKDLWVTCVNNFPQSFAGNALKNVDPSSADEGVSSKHVSVGTLARYGYDVSHVLGSVLSNKYDFTSVQGIGRAYKALFEGGGPDLQAVDSDLKKLEAVRHVIVHNAGRADQAFVDRIGRGYALGDPIELNGEQLHSFAFAVKTAGKTLLKTADRWALSTVSR